MALGGDGDSLRLDSQRASYSSDGVVGGDVGLTVHHLIALCYGVVTCLCISYVGHATCCCGYELVARQQLAIGNGHSGVAMCCAVVGPLAATSRNGDSHTGGSHRQFTVYCRHTVVASSTLRELVALNLVLHRTLRRQRDATRHDSRDGIVAHQSVDIVLSPALSGTRIGEGVALGSDGQRLA